MQARIIVLGGTGFIGRNICAQMRARDFEVLAFGSGDFDLSVDASILELASHVNEGDRVVAAFAKAPARTEEDLFLNIEMTRRFIAAVSAKSPGYVLNVSSDAIYCDSMQPLNEASISAPTSFHGTMHCVREKMIDSGFSCDVGHLRPTLVYGADDPHGGYGPNKFIKDAKGSQTVSLFGEGEERRDHIHVEDVSYIATEMIALSYGGAVNAVTGELISFAQIAEMVINKFGPNCELQKISRSGAMPHNGYRAFDNSCATKLMRDRSFITLRQYIQGTPGLAKI